MNQAGVRWLLFVVLVLLAFTDTRLLAQFGTKGGTMQISTSSFPAEGTIPKKHTCDAQDISPAFTWTGAPPSTRSFALIADDPDAPVGTWNHWLIWNVPASVHQFAEGVAKTPTLPDGSRQGQNDFKKVGYNGPCPPPGKPHRYYFKLFALDMPLDLRAGATRKELEAAMKGHVVAENQIMGRYGR